MASFNKVVLMGNITKDIELKQTQSGLSVCSFDIAVQRKGQKKEVDFITVVAWRNTAEFVSRYFKKGSSIIVCGQLQTRKWTDNNGNNRVAVEVVADEVGFTASNSTQGEQSQSQGNNYIPDAYKSQQTQNFEEIAVAEDEGLPF